MQQSYHILVADGDGEDDGEDAAGGDVGGEVLPVTSGDHAHQSLPSSSSSSVSSACSGTKS